MANNKIVLADGRVLIDLTADTASAESVLAGQTFHDKSGAIVNGTCTYDSDTSEDTIAVGEMLDGKTAHARGVQLTGTMPNIGKQTSTISTKSQSVTISKGYHDGSGTVAISTTEKNKIIAGNIKNGVTILGITGNYAGDSVEVPEVGREVAPTFADQDITPASGYTCFQAIKVKAIPVVYAANAAGGQTVTIG